MEQGQRIMVLVGIPSSGKSAFAEEVLEGRDDIVYLPSDDNEDFNQVMIIIKEALIEGKHVIYNATNISRKRRRGLLQQIPKGIKKVAVYMNTSLNEIKERNLSRASVIPEQDIHRIYKKLQVPIYSEGWDNIVIHHSDETMMNQLDKRFSDIIRAGVLFGREGYELMSFLATYFDEFFGILDMPQDSKYHGFSVSRHTYHTYRYVLDNYKTEDETEKELMLWTALLHDIGKVFCKSFLNSNGEETRYANFIGHENVGSQIAINLLHRMNFTDEFIHTVSTMIQFHMFLVDEKVNKGKLIDYVGQDIFKKLEFFLEADIKSH